MYICNCFVDETQKWALNHMDTTWDLFNTLFIEKYGFKKDVDSILLELARFHMLPNEKPQDYIDRFHVLKMDYDREKERRRSSVNDATRAFSSASTPLAFPRHPMSTSQPSNPINQEEDNNISSPNNNNPGNILVDALEEDHVIITEMAFVNYFIQGIRPDFTRLFIKHSNPVSLFQTYALLKESADDFKNHNYESPDVKQSDPTPKTSLVEHSSRNEDLVIMANAIKELTSEVRRLKMANTGTTSAALLDDPPKANFLCYNCQGKGHKLRECPEPCEICQENHVYVNCPSYVVKAGSDKGRVEKVADAKLIEAIEEQELLTIGEKRSLPDSEYKVNQDKKGWLPETRLLALRTNLKSKMFQATSVEELLHVTKRYKLMKKTILTDLLMIIETKLYLI